MKKLICVIFMLAVIIGLGAAETVYSSRLYRDLNARLIDVRSNIEKASTDGDFTAAEKGIDEVVEVWENNKEVVLMLTNHSTVRALDDKFVSLKAWIECEGYEDAAALCDVSIALTEDMMDETYPVLGNLF